MLRIQKEVFCLGHIVVDICINRLVLSNLRLGGCIDSKDLAIHGGGDAANVSFWLGKLNIPISFIGTIANDSAGYFVKNELENARVKCRLKISKQFPTASILIIIEPNGERSFIRNIKSQEVLEWEDLPLAEIRGCSLFYTSAYTIENYPIKGVINRLFQYIKEKNSSPPITMYNLAAYTTIEEYGSEIKSNILPYTDILVGNTDEFKLLVDKNNDRKKLNPLNIGEEIREKNPNLKVILITDGRNGCYFIAKNNKGHITAPKVPVLDTTGAGDGFCAGFISKYVSGGDLQEAIRTGVRLGSHICQGYGPRFDPSKFE